MLECTPRLYTSERWGSSFRFRSKTIQNYQSVKRDIMTFRNLFDRQQEHQEVSHWVKK